jgi:uncharacterized tellurite resistance protein B-like protein
VIVIGDNGFCTYLGGDLPEFLMFDTISRLFAQKESPDLRHEPRLAVAALLVHLAAVDGATKPEERDAVKHALMDYYALDENEVEKLVDEATRRDNEAVDFYRFTSAITALPEDERIEIIRMMWQVVFADDKNHELEDNMVWRIAELIGVSARQRTILRNQMAKG